MKPRGKVRKGCADSLTQPDEFMGEITACRQTVRRPQLEEHPTDEHIGNVGQHIFTELICHHA